jgi:hypothetical protein
MGLRSWFSVQPPGLAVRQSSLLAWPRQLAWTRSTASPIAKAPHGGNISPCRHIYSSTRAPENPDSYCALPNFIVAEKCLATVVVASTKMLSKIWQTKRWPRKPASIQSIIAISRTGSVTPQPESGPICQAPSNVRLFWSYNFPKSYPARGSRLHDAFARVQRERPHQRRG